VLDQVHIIVVGFSHVHLFQMIP